MRWKRFWVIVIVMLASAAESFHNFFMSLDAAREELKGQLASLGSLYAHEITKQLRVSISSLQALEALVNIDEQGSMTEHFDNVSTALRETYQGITTLMLAPQGVIQQISPLRDRGQALGQKLLLHPQRAPEALEGIRQRMTQVSKSSRNVNGAAAIARRPIFTSYAQESLPEDWWMIEGVNYTRNCSTPELRKEFCSFPGPPDKIGRQTYFWGFVIMISDFKDLLANIDLPALEFGGHVVDGERHFAYQLFSAELERSMQEMLLWPHSSTTEPLSDPVVVPVTIPEYSMAWYLELAPMRGWEAFTASMDRRLAVTLSVTVAFNLFLSIAVLARIRKQAMETEQALEHQRMVHTCAVEASIDSMANVHFPFCLLCVTDFEEYGSLISFEDARDQGLHSHVDDTQELGSEEGVILVSHERYPTSDGDPQGTLYAAICDGLRQMRGQGITCNWLWVEFSCIPQRNSVQRQCAINSLAAYARCCSSLLCIPRSRHSVRSGDVHGAVQWHSAWARLERLCFVCGHLEVADKKALIYKNGVLALDEGLCCDVDSLLGIYSGGFECCDSCHPDGGVCDKQRFCGVMLGMYWHLLAAQKNRPTKMGKALLDAIQADEPAYFPAETTYCCESDTLTVNLFKGYSGVVRDLFEFRQGASNQRTVSDVTGKTEEGESLCSTQCGSGRSSASVSLSTALRKDPDPVVSIMM